MAGPAVFSDEDFAPSPTPAQAPSPVGSGAPIDEDDFLPSYADGSDPSKPINKSPVDVLDRLKMSAGNDKGKLGFLKSKFEDARYDKSGNFVVKKDGLWHRADANGLGDGDAWEISKELAKDVMDLGDVAINVAGSMVGAAKGALLGAPAGPAGAVAGGIVGSGTGGAASEVMRTSLGRLAGTYDATPQEQMKDIGTEFLLSLGGEAVALGVKPTLKMVGNAFKNIGKATSANNASKEMLSVVASGMTGEPKQAFRAAMDMPDAIIPKAERLVKEMPNAAPELLKAEASRKQFNILKTYAAEADTALKQRYAEGMKRFVESVPEDFKADPSQIIRGMQNDIIEAGYAVRDAKGIVRVPNEKDLMRAAENLGDARTPRMVEGEMKDALENLLNLTNKYDRAYFGRQVEGKAGAMRLQEFYKGMRESIEGAVSDWSTPAGRVAAKLKDNLKNRMVEAMDRNKVVKVLGEEGGTLSNRWVGMDKQYSSYKDAANLVTTAVRNAKKEPGALEGLVKRLTGRDSANVGLKDEVKTLSDLLPGKGQQLMSDLTNWEHAKSFVGLTPRTFEGGSLTSATRLAATAATGGLATNPRAIGRTIKYGNKALDFVKGLPASSRTQLLTNEKALATFLKTVTEASQSEDATTQELLNQAGVQ